MTMSSEALVKEGVEGSQERAFDDHSFYGFGLARTGDHWSSFHFKDNNTTSDNATIKTEERHSGDIKRNSRLPTGIVFIFKDSNLTFSFLLYSSRWTSMLSSSILPF